MNKIKIPQNVPHTIDIIFSVHMIGLHRKNKNVDNRNLPSWNFIRSH